MSDIKEFAKNLRHNQTEAEKKLWYKIRNRQLNNLKFRRQHPIPPYIIDFYCDDLKLAIELDGGQHTEEKDKTRTNFLTENGITVLRYWNNDILKNIDSILEDIEKKTNTPSPQPSPQGEGVKRICIAKIATAHGIKGLVKLHVFAEDINLLKNDLFTSDTGDKKLSIKLKNATAKHWIAEVEGITDRDDAEKLRGTALYINQDALPKPEDGAFYFTDLIGLQCVDTKDKDIGKVIAVENFGAGDLLEIQPVGTERFYLPFNDDTILEIGENKIIVVIPEGLLE